MASAENTEGGLGALYQVAYQDQRLVASARDTEDALNALYQIASQKQ